MGRSIACASLFVLLQACSTWGDDETSRDDAAPDEVAATAEIALTQLTTCDDLDELLREKARAQMNALMDAERTAALSREGYSCVAYASTTSGNSVSIGASEEVSSDTSTSSTSDAPSSVSETNNQVAGVDEADLVKTDGQYLYLAQGSELRIVQAWPAEDAKTASRVTVGGTAKKLFLLGDRVLVYVSVPRASVANNADWMGGQASDCTYGYSCDFSGDGTATQLLIFDVTDRTGPTLLRTIDLPGSLIAARRIGSAVHTVASIGDLSIPRLETYYSSYYNGCGTWDEEDVAAELAAIEAMRDRNNALIDASSFDVGVVASENGEAIGGAADCSDFYRELTNDGYAITTILSLDLEDDTAAKVANVVSRAGAVYASDESLYMAVPHRDGTDSYWHDAVGVDEASTIHRFGIGSDVADTGYLASGVVPGHVLNQFAMDEHDGVLRVATSKGAVPDPDVVSTLSVMKQEGSELSTIGFVDGIAPGEDIRSVRFEGERGYVVTFKKTDPLFVLDLADPEQPSVVGELKIPGFSTYMHPLEGDYLLALGYEADDQGSYAYFNGIQLQLFDVTVPTEPVLLHKKVYGTRGSSSSALTDHLGFTFLPARELLTLPMSICDGGGDGMYGTLSFSGVVALDVNLDEGFTELGRLEEPYPATVTEFQYGGACADWWTDSNSVVQRTVVMDDFLYAVSDNRVRVQNLTALGTDVKVVDF